MNTTSCQGFVCRVREGPATRLTFSQQRSRLIRRLTRVPTSLREHTDEHTENSFKSSSSSRSELLFFFFNTAFFCEEPLCFGFKTFLPLRIIEIWHHARSHSLSRSHSFSLVLSFCISTIISIVEQQFSFLNVQIVINYQNVNFRDQKQMQITKIFFFFVILNKKHPQLGKAACTHALCIFSSLCFCLH